MDGILKALGFDSKPDYTEKIPETLTPDHFYVHNTFHHGFPDQPTCLDYDPVQQLLAVGAQNGRVLLLGKPGLEQYIIHPNNEHVLQMKFISNKGLLITMCDPRTLYLWSLKEKNPCILHTLELNKERPTCISHTCGSDWIYVGTDAGNVHVVHIHTFKISGFTIYWNHALDVSYRGSPGEVKSVEEHPMDQGKVLISFGCGYCVLYDMKCNNSQAVKDARVDPHKRFCYDPGHSHVLTSTCWLGNGRYFVCAYSNGCVVQWNIKVDSKPEKIFFIHETPDPSAFKPVYKIQVVHTDGEHPWYLCSGGFPEESSEAPRTLSVLRGKSISMLSSSSTILDFVCLPSSPYPYQCQKPFALVVLSKNELIFYDLLTPTFPKFDCSLLPYALDIHHPPVSSVYYCANCPEEFVGQLHSVRSKTVTAHAKPWPLKGGKWGQEVPHVSTDLILTGHTDGSVRLWYCSSVVLQPFFTLHTNTYFKMNYQPSTINLKSPPAGDASSVPQDGRKRVPPSRPPPPSKPPPRSLKSQVSQPTNTHSSAEAGNTTESNVSKSTSHPQLSISIPEAEIHVESQDQRISNTPSPATGQLRPESQELIDGGEATAARVGSPEGDRRTVFSREKKSIFKKRKNDDSNGTKLDVSPSGKDERKFSPKLSSKSFRKVAKIVKLSGGVRKSKKSVAVKEEGQEELDGREQSTESEEALSPAHSQAKADHQDPSTSPKRPTDITLRQVSTTETVMTTASSTPSDILTNNSETARHVQRSSSSSSDDFIHVPLPPQASNYSSNPSQTRSKTPQAQKIPTLPKLSETKETSSSPPPMFSTDPHSQFMEGEEFFSINEMHICICGQWLCVSNTGGIVMAFDFRLKNTEKKIPKYLEVNFDSDSVVKQYVPGSASTPKSSTSMSPSASPAPLSPGFQSYGQWVFEEKVHDVKPGFQLMQVVLCSSHSSNSSSGSASGRGSAASTTSGGRKPIMISSMQYSIDMGLLAIGTNSGFVVIDTFSNTCLCTLSSLTSILYMADPSRFTRQMKRESQLSLAEPRKATIKRHATSMAFSVKVKEGAESPTKRVQSAKMFTTTPRAQSQPHFTAAAVNTDEHDGMITLSELDSCVSALEIVQLQLDKQTLPTLTLWVGLASGYVVAYGINIMKGEEQDGTKRKIELVPTRFIIETGKSPIVGLFFLNMWGDCQVVPYHPRRTLSVSSEEKLEDAIKRVRNRVQQQQKEQSPSNCPQHYAIIVDETQIKSFSFPGFNKINNCVPPFPKESVILRSEYFSCQDLPCLLSVTSCHHLLVHSLPGLKPLMKLQYSPLCEAMAMCTFRVSGMGQALYMCSHSEIQRLSIVKEDMLNLPNCLPSLYVSIKDPPQTPSSKGLLGGLFASAPTAINQTLLFGESARRPVGNLYKLDGKTGTVYSGREIETTRVRRGKGTESNRGAERDQISHRKGGSKGVSGQMERNVEALHLRKEKLSNIEERTAEVADHASEFASMAARLAKKYEKR